MEGTNLEGAIMKRARLREVNFEGANLKGANLEKAYLYGSKIDLHQLGEVASLEGAVMPDGTIYNNRWAQKIEKLKMPEEVCV